MGLDEELPAEGHRNAARRRPGRATRPRKPCRRPRQTAPFRDRPDAPPRPPVPQCRSRLPGRKAVQRDPRFNDRPDARLYKKSSGTGAMLCFMGHALMENRSGLIVQADLTRACGHAERRVALSMIHAHSPGSTRQLTLGADRGYDSADFVRDLRQACVTPHVARKTRIRRSTVAPRDTRATPCPRSIASGSRSPSAGARLSEASPRPSTAASNASAPASS